MEQMDGSPHWHLPVRSAVPESAWQQIVTPLATDCPTSSAWGVPWRLIPAHPHTPEHMGSLKGKYLGGPTSGPQKRESGNLQECKD